MPYLDARLGLHAQRLDSFLQLAAEEFAPLGLCGGVGALALGGDAAVELARKSFARLAHGLGGAARRRRRLLAGVELELRVARGGGGSGE